MERSSKVKKTRRKTSIKTEDNGRRNAERQFELALNNGADIHFVARHCTEREAFTVASWI